MSTNKHRTRPRDIGAFLANYPGAPKSDPDKDPSANYFYLNRLRCQPDNVLIDNIHSRWYADDDELEWNHTYIQWLFPIQEGGVSAQAYRLPPHEIEMTRHNRVIVHRLVKSFGMMLDFYGMCLLSSDTGLLGRSRQSRVFKSRYRNLVSQTHNNLRITRILECLSEMGLERLNAGFLLHVLNKQSEHGMLKSAPLQLSMNRCWADCIRDDGEREWVRQDITKSDREESSRGRSAIAVRQTSGNFPADMAIQNSVRSLPRKRGCCILNLTLICTR